MSRRLNLNAIFEQEIAQLNDNGVIPMPSYIVYAFLVFAGMLIWHFLTYRDRSEEEEARLQLIRDNEELKGNVAHLGEMRASLDERCSRQTGQLNVLQQLCDDWSTSREQSDREQAQLEVDLKHRAELAEKAAAELELEKQRRIALEDQLHKQTQAQIEQQGAIEQRWQSEHAKIESALCQRQTELASTQSETKRLADKLHAAESRVAQLQSQMATNKSLLKTAKKNASGLEQEYVTLETSLRESSHLLSVARSEAAATDSARKVAEDALQSLKAEYETLQASNESLIRELKSLEAVATQNQSLKESIASVKQEFGRVIGQRDAAINAEKAIQITATGLQKRIDNQEATIHGLRDSRNEAMESLKKELAIRTGLEATFAQQKNQLETRLQQQTSELTQQSRERESQFGQQRGKLQEQLENHTLTIKQLTGQRDELLNELTSTRDKMSEVQGSLQQNESTVQELEAEVEAMGTLQVRIRELESLLQRREAEMEQLNVTSDEAELLRSQFSSLQDQYAIARRRQNELEENLTQLDQEREHDRSLGLSYQGQLDQLQNKLAASAETIRNLRRERAAVLARLANYRTIVEPEQNVISFTQAMKLQKEQNESYDTEYGGHTSHHAKRGLIYTSEPETRDDLKRISGIAEVLEARLNDYGIYTFKQVIEWSPEAIDEFSSLLAFRDRIQRDDWQGQARYFYKQKQQPAGEPQRAAA